MSELKHQLMLNKKMSWVPCYMKDEADKVIEELNRKIKLYEDLGSCKKGCLALRHNQRRVESEIYRVKLKEKEILHHKYKRCLAMAEWCNSGMVVETFACFRPRSTKEVWREEHKYWAKWRKRWLELAEKFKETK